MFPPSDPTINAEDHTMATASDAPLHALEQPADPHPAWWAEAERLLAAHGADDDVAAERRFALLDRIAATPAASLDGVTEQLRLAVRCLKGGAEIGPCEERALENALASLERLAGEARSCASRDGECQSATPLIQSRPRPYVVCWGVGAKRGGSLCTV
jgi:hypothetical protein